MGTDERAHAVIKNLGRSRCRERRHFYVAPIQGLVFLALYFSSAFLQAQGFEASSSPGMFSPMVTESQVSSSVRPELFPSPTRDFPPAWAQEPFDASQKNLKPFGSHLFKGRFSTSYFANLNQAYLIIPGDRVAVRMWGARKFDEVLAVDQQGNLFLPEIGPIHVQGLTQEQMTAQVKRQLAKVFTGNVEVYVNLMTAQPVAVYVTGFVNKPGRYAGGVSESPLYYLDQAGGINALQGSYRHLEIRRGHRLLDWMDLYDFILKGTVPELRFEDGDVIVVKKKGPTVTAVGRLPEPALFELSGNQTKGELLIKLASPLNSVTHVSVSGVRNREPYRAHLTLDEFRNFVLHDNDTVEFQASGVGESIMVNVVGAVRDGASAHHLVRRGATLRGLLPYVAIDEATADPASIYLRRRRVADEQKKALEDALKRLERSILTATSSSMEEANIRVREAELMSDFIKRASEVQPNGTVVVSRKGVVADLMLEDGDTIVIPQKSGVVLVSGEVVMPNSLVWSPNMRLKDYIAGAGGYTDRANRSNILAIKPSGEVIKARVAGKVEPGDRLLVMPVYDTKNLQIVKDVTQILYQIAVATGIALRL
ncbi:MAG: polysaccharide biosynthesis/export family protein [Deltaproteobacteria bacterium]|nr:polysaccharide biosynthesis/export family protein [Deltaproteobacteria bacterium]